MIARRRDRLPIAVGIDQARRYLAAENLKSSSSFGW
jgi:hypothetical protein